MQIAMMLLMSLLSEIKIQPVVEYGDWTPPTSATPFVGIWHNRGPVGIRYVTMNDNVVSKVGGLSIAKDKIDINLNGKTIWTDGVGVYGYDGIDGQLATELLASGKTPESRAISRKGMLEEWAIPESVTIRNGTIVAPVLTNLPKEVLKIGTNVTYVTEGPVVGDDEKLPITYRAVSRGNNPAEITNLQWTVSDPAKATWEPRVATDPPAVAGYFVPVGPIGVVRLTATGVNRKNQPVTGFLDIQIIPGAATVIVIESLPPIDR